jgi:hypothetical protein
VVVKFCLAKEIEGEKGQEEGEEASDYLPMVGRA